MESQPACRQNALLIASPHVYKEQLSIAAARSFLEQQGIALAQVCSVQSLDEQPPMAVRWRAKGIALVIAAGGDGTIGAAASHLAGSEMPLGILPLGTSNDFARSLRLPLELAEACRTIATGHETSIDLGCAQPALTAPNLLHDIKEEEEAFPSAPNGERAFFTHALTLGLNVAFARLATRAAMRQRFGMFTYPVAALETLSTSQPLDFTLTFRNLACSLAPEESENEIEDGRPYHYQALQVAVINSPIFGGQLKVALAGVELHDHLLDILIVERFDLRQLLAAAQTAFVPAKNGWREAVSRRFPGIRHVKAGEVMIETPQPMDVTLDGELRGRTPLRALSAPHALKVIVPQVYTAAAQSGGAGGRNIDRSLRQ